MSKTLVSCGVLVMNAQAELLMGHATGAAHWDIPKGVPEPGESQVATAVRELAEETGLAVSPTALHPIGRFAYRPNKDLHLFGLLADRFDSHGCTCSSEFVDRHGRRRPEMDAFAWVAFDDVERRAAGSMAKVLTRVISLQDVLAHLASGAAPPAPGEAAAHADAASR